MQPESEQREQRDDQDRHEDDRPTLALRLFRFCRALGLSRGGLVSLCSGSRRGRRRGGRCRSSGDEVGLLLRVGIGIGVSLHRQRFAP